MTTPLLAPLLDHARRIGNRPRIHGNGFLQLDLSTTARLHIFGHPAIPQQAQPTPIHDHRFAFTSLVLKGEMRNQKYQLQKRRHWSYTPTHEVYRAVVRDREDTILVPTGTQVRLYQKMIQTVGLGESYTMAIGEIHESIVDQLTVTVIQKSGPTLAQGGPSPSVYVPKGMVPDNTFNRYALPEDRLWQIIHESVV